MSIDTTKPTPCLACGQQLQPAMPGHPRVPYNGTVFISHGHYGSTVFDDMHGRWIEIVICDDCLRSKTGTGVIAHAAPRHVPQPEPIYTEFDPERD